MGQYARLLDLGLFLCNLTRSSEREDSFVCLSMRGCDISVPVQV